MEKKLNIIFISQVTINHIDERNIYCDLLREFTQHGHHVDIFTAFERRNKNNFLKREVFQNHTITRIKTPNLQKTSKIEKAVGHLLFDRIILRALKKHLNKNTDYHVTLYYTPPITIINSLKYLKEKYNTYNYLWLKDIFPQNAVDIGLMKKNGWSFKFFKYLEKKFYHVSDKIGCMSPQNVTYLLENYPYLTTDKVECNPNCISITSDNVPVTSDFRARFDIPQNARLLVYGGNLGLPQGVDFILEVLEKLKNHPTIYFIIIGSGTEYSKLQKWKIKNNPQNVQLHPFLPKNEFDQAVHASDIGLIFLDHKFTIPNFPSRLLTYLEHKKPVLAFTDTSTDIGRIIKDNQFGDWAPSDHAEKVVKTIIDYSNLDISQLQQLGENAYQYLLDNYLASDSYQKIINAYLSNQKTYT